MFHQPDTTNTCNKLFFFRKTVLLWFSSTWVWISFKFIVLSHGFALQSFYQLTTKNYIITEAGIIKYLICIRAVLFMFEEEMLADEEYQVLCSTIFRDIISNQCSFLFQTVEAAVHWLNCVSKWWLLQSTSSGSPLCVVHKNF